LYGHNLELISIGNELLAFSFERGCIHIKLLLGKARR
jgi:hypothetical protein